MSTLSYYTQRLGGKFAPYSQAAQIARKGLASRQGICTSCSLTYLAMDRSRLKFGEEKDKQTTMAFIDSGQNLYESPLQTPSSIPNLSAQAENLITGLGFKALEHSGPSWAPNVVAATFIRAREKYFLVWMPLHACAAIRTAGAAGDGRVKFFDPNYGQATFANTNKFEFFLATYLSDLKIMENYGMGGGGLGTGVGDPTFVYLLA